MIHIVLYQPEIPQNTGNIMRTCVGAGMHLHLIKPLGFSLEEKHLRRSALDYFEHLRYSVHESWEDFVSSNPGTYYFLTRYGEKRHSDIDFKASEQPIYLIFGKESTGIPRELLSENYERCFRIPTTDQIRSLNLSNCVALVSYEALRQLDYPGLITHEPETLKGKDFLSQFKK